MIARVRRVKIGGAMVIAVLLAAVASRFFLG